MAKAKNVVILPVVPVVRRFLQLPPAARKTRAEVVVDLRAAIRERERKQRLARVQQEARDLVAAIERSCRPGGDCG